MGKAPPRYEADAQLAYMCRAGYLHAVISEDSDLFVYGCPRVLAKVDKHGFGDLIEIHEVVNCDRKNQESGWVTICITHPVCRTPFLRRRRW